MVEIGFAMSSQLSSRYSCFHTSLEVTDRETVLTVGGELDMASAPVLGDAVLDACAAGPGSVVVDAFGVTFVDAAGLRGLLGGYQPAVLSRVRVRNASPPLIRLLGMVGMPHLIEGRSR